MECLIVEDNPVNWMIMQNQLKKLGLASTVCSNGREALDYCASHPLPPLILLDGTMPVMDGITFLKHFCKLPGQRTTVVVFCSSSLDLPDVQKALEIRADCHFPKPLTPEHWQWVAKAIRDGRPASRRSWRD